jgi:hypothetical protein
MTHFTEDQFQQFYDESLDAETSEIILHHLENCESCLDRFNQWLEAGDPLPANGAQPFFSDNFQHKLIRRINREEAARAMVRFSVNGLLAVFGLAVRSLFIARSKKPPSQRAKVRVEE